MVGGLLKDEMVHFGYFKCLLYKPIMLCMLLCHSTYCSLLGIPLYAIHFLKLHFVILIFANVGGKMVEHVQKHVKQSVRDQW